jgi:hypothetical protein
MIGSVAGHNYNEMNMSWMNNAPKHFPLNQVASAQILARFFTGHGDPLKVLHPIE